jgi:peroxiredoxin
MKQFGLVISMLLLISSLASAQVKYSNEFLSIGAGARLMGMGGAGTAMVDDASAGYWNPARLINVPGKLDFTLMHSEYFAGLAKYDYGSVAYKLDSNSAIGLSVIRFAVDDIPNTLELIDQEGNIRYDRITTFSAADMGVLFSYARKMKITGLQAGANVKLIYRHTGEFAKAWGFGMDAAIAYSVSNWRLSAVARDITGTFNVWSFKTDLLSQAFEMSGNELPVNSLEVTVPRLILAAARDFKISDQLTLALAFDTHLTFDGRRHVILPIGPVGIDPYIGGELRFSSWLFARLGFGNFQLVPGMNGKDNLNLQPNLGLGIQYHNIYIDYALTDLGDLSVAQYSNLISLRYLLK